MIWTYPEGILKALKFASIFPMFLTVNILNKEVILFFYDKRGLGPASVSSTAQSASKKRAPKQWGSTGWSNERLYSHFYLRQAELSYVIETGSFSSSFGGYVLNGDKFNPLPQHSRKSKTLFRGGVRAWGGTALRLEVYVGKVD